MANNNKKKTQEQSFREGAYSTPQGRRVYNNSKTNQGRRRALANRAATSVRTVTTLKPTERGMRTTSGPEATDTTPA